jgi:hypothetical protein
MSAKFVFEYGDGKKLSVPSFKDLPTGALRASRHAESDVDKAFIILEYTLGVDSKELATIDTMPLDTFSDFVKGWTDGAPVGE